MSVLVYSHIPIYIIFVLVAGVLRQLCEILMASGVPADVLTEVCEFHSLVVFHYEDLLLILCVSI